MNSNIVSLITAVLLLSITLVAQEETKQVPKMTTQPTTSGSWKAFGDKITMSKTTTLSKVVKNPGEFVDKEVLLEGTISEVCQNKGCWMVVGDGGEHVRVEFKDYGFFVPRGSKGKKVKLQGKLSDKTISAEAAEHMASEMKDPPVKSEEVKGEQKITVFVATGISIKGGADLDPEQKEIIDGKKESEGHQHETHQR